MVHPGELLMLVQLRERHVTPHVIQAYQARHLGRLDGNATLPRVCASGNVALSRVFGGGGLGSAATGCGWFAQAASARLRRAQQNTGIGRIRLSIWYLARATHDIY